jgi:hypothetical protein
VNPEAWRQSLIAFYREEGSFQSAENVARGDALSIADKRVIRSIQAANEKAPERQAA